MTALRTIVLCFILVSEALVTQAQVITTDSLALVALYNSTNGPGWTRKNNWLVGPVNTWYGITVVGNRVRQINMNPSSPPFSGNNLTGSLPTAIGSLTGLTSLDLAYNKLGGSIPPQIGTLTSLTFLNISNNLLTGVIPTTVGGMTNLSVLQLNNNQISGTIPTQMGMLSKLTQINLTFNRLSGNIPMQLGSLPMLTQLLLQNNLLSGTIPIQLGSLSNLLALSLGENQLTGSIPPQIGSLGNLLELNLTTNLLTGGIPIELGNLAKILILRLNRNQLTGSVPKELGNLSKLQELLLGNNQLSGVIPAEISSLPNLALLQLQNNSLTDLPPFSKTTLITLNVSNNNLTFEDLEPNIGITNYTYVPQKIIPGGPTQNLIIGNPFTLAYTIGGTANQYQWKKDGVNRLGNSSVFSIPAVAFLDSGFYELFITNTLVPNLTLQTEPTRLNVAGLPVIDFKVNGSNQPPGTVIIFELTDVGDERFKDFEIFNSGTASIRISDIQLTGDFMLQTSIPPKIDPGNSQIFTIRFSPSAIGLRQGTLTIISNSNQPTFTINLSGEGDAELEIFNVVSTNPNGKHDFLNIRNIWLYPKNRVQIYDRWGNEVYNQNGYDNIAYKFSGTSDTGKDLPEGTYFYVIDIGQKVLTGFLFLRRN